MLVLLFAGKVVEFTNSWRFYAKKNPTKSGERNKKSNEENSNGDTLKKTCKGERGQFETNFKNQNEEINQKLGQSS